MNYTEFKKIYNWMVKNYPDTTFSYDHFSDTIATVETTEYKKIGGRWIMTSSKTETATGEFYANTFGAVPFFRNMGGYEKVEKRYTRFGNIPFKVTSISPDKTTKVIREFTINKI